MISKSFQEYYELQKGKIVTQFNLAKKFYSVEAIHEMRVEIKKLRAFFNIVEWINPDFLAKNNFKKIKKIFKSAGTIRDIHVQQKLTMNWIKKLNIELSEYYNHLKQLEIKRQPQFNAISKKFKPNEFDKNWNKIYESLNILPQNFIQFKIEERFYRLVENLLNFKDKTPFTLEDYHKIRILSKETRYSLEILQFFFPEVGQFDQLNLKIRDLHRALGHWHDDEMGQLMLKDFVENFSEETFFNRNSYNEFIIHLEDDKKKWITTFEKRWKEFIEFLNHEGPLNLIETKFSLN
jgi:CHAD domain-containing protein